MATFDQVATKLDSPTKESNRIPLQLSAAYRSLYSTTLGLWGPWEFSYSR